MCSLGALQQPSARPPACAPTRPPQTAKAWLAAGCPTAADWPLQQLRERLAALEAVTEDDSQADDVRCAAQLLQFYALQGSIVLATRAGHQVCWCDEGWEKRCLLLAAQRSSPDACCAGKQRHPLISAS